ncbi:ketopantoate reductase family protein [Nocardia callitridis]|uniref:2-dehydropantoate 2-reductase N-terminal domain-containing protein n=1 Tax=Nocardia callitridis TaxID=648753 RepID=A0ABP9K626_9NOCA
MTRYVIVGAGAVGAALAVQLRERGHEILLVARGETLEHLARKPLSYHTHAGHQDVSLPVVGPDDDFGLRVGDLLVLAVKTQDLPATLPSLAWREVRDGRGAAVGVAADTLPLITVQNGLDAEGSAARWFDSVIGAVMMLTAQYSRVGEVRVGGHPHIGGVIAGHSVGARATTEPVVRAFVDDVRDAGFVAAAVDDIAACKAGKLLHNVRNGVEVFAGPRATKDAVGAALTAEAREVFLAAGIEFRDAPDLVLDPAQQYTSERAGVRAGRTSTWQSFTRGVANEVDYLNGEIALLARQHGLTAPLNARLQQLLGRAAADGGGTDLSGLAELTK